ncbi:MAG: hypothetical protein KF850_24335 [Labilithrix sp.]|nr:hypothetical protein [Labilithrix sp.]
MKNASNIARALVSVGIDPDELRRQLAKEERITARWLGALARSSHAADRALASHLRAVA